jgi:uncharacterized protein (TIGR02145 family)
LRNALCVCNGKFACIALLCAIALNTHAQVTIGALDEPVKGTLLDLSPKSAPKLGGLRLPNIFITNSDSLPASLIGVDAFTLAELDKYPNLEGMIVYNSNPDLPGGAGLFIWNGSQWRKTGSDNEFKSECENVAITGAGGDIDCSSIDEFCSLNADYIFSLLAGGDFCTLTVIDAPKGKFNLSFDPNPTAEPRTVIVLVTSPCGASYSFVYQQDGDTGGCGTSSLAPIIKGENTTDICAGGAAYLYLDGRPSGTYVWTRNGVQVATGTDYVATQSGRYIVYADKIGCIDVKPDTLMITIGSTPAPAAVSISAKNSGMVCGAADLAEITATTPPSGTVEWYKDGVRQASLSGQTVINADLGKWFAAVTDGGCSSLKSNTIMVSVSPDAGVALPDYTISGPTYGNVGDTKTYIATTATPQSGVDYLWTVNAGTTGATVIGSNTSNALQVHFPAQGKASINLSVSNCCETATVTNNDLPVTVGDCAFSLAPKNNTNVIAYETIGGVETLTVTPSGTAQYTYQWYSNASNSSVGGTSLGAASGAQTTSYDADISTQGTTYYYCVASYVCENTTITATSGVFVLNVEPKLSTQTVGSGVFVGRTCFDVAESNDGGTCGPLSERRAETLTANGLLADFSTSVTNTQIYTFTPSGTVSNVRFRIVEPTGYAGQIVESVLGGDAGNNISSPVTCQIIYKNDLNAKASGKTETDALRLEIYVVYNDGANNDGTDKVLKLTALIKDCICCGAKTIDGGWLNFLCYNLGADPTLATPAQQQAASPATTWINSDGVTTSRIYGNYYQWGNNLALTSIASITENNWKNATTTTAGTPGYFGSSYNNVWDDGGAKGVNDPCPEGFRIPSKADLFSIANNVSGNSDLWTNSASGVTTASGNVWTYKATTTHGELIGNRLFLPLAGSRGGTATNSIWEQGSYGGYWLRTPYDGTYGYHICIKTPSLQDAIVGPSYGASRTTGLAIRCVSE